jgi:hypothetical protein
LQHLVAQVVSSCGAAAAVGRSTATLKTGWLAGSKREMRGSLTSSRSSGLDGGHLLAHVLGGLAAVDVEVELHDDDRAAFVAAREQRIDAGDGVDASSTFLVTSASTISGEAPG